MSQERKPDDENFLNFLDELSELQVDNKAVSDDEPHRYTGNQVQVAQKVYRELAGLAIDQSLEPDVARKEGIGFNSWYGRQGDAQSYVSAISRAFPDRERDESEQDHEEELLLSALFLVIDREKVEVVGEPRKISIPTLITPSTHKDNIEKMVEEYSRPELVIYGNLLHKSKEKFAGRPVNVDPYARMAVEFAYRSVFPDSLSFENVEAPDIFNSEDIARESRKFVRDVSSGERLFPQNAVAQDGKDTVFYIEREIEGTSYWCALYRSYAKEGDYISKFEVVRVGDTVTHGMNDLDKSTATNPELATYVSGITEAIAMGTPLAKKLYVEMRTHSERLAFEASENDHPNPPKN